MRKLASKSVEQDAERNRIASLHLLDLVKEKSLRDKLKQQLFGSPTDKIAEWITAYLTNTIVENGHGYDCMSKTGKKVETKFSFINKSLTSRGHPRCQAMVDNLASKDCDLFIFVVDSDLPTSHENYLRTLHIPRKVWKDKWKNNDGSMSFGSDQKKWYKDYQVQH